MNTCILHLGFSFTKLMYVVWFQLKSSLDFILFSQRRVQDVPLRKRYFIFHLNGEMQPWLHGTVEYVYKYHHTVSQFTLSTCWLV